MNHSAIVITNLHYRRLIQLTGHGGDRNKSTGNLGRLAGELERAKKVDSEKVSPDIVTMNSIIELTDMENKITKRVKLVYPQESDISKGCISVLAPVGTAILGYRKGDIIEWEVPAGKKKFQIRDIIYQPEANGEYLM